MDKVALRKAIENSVREFSERRDYLGMSQISRCPLALYNDMVKGGVSNRVGRLMCHEGYLHERDVLERMIAAQFNVVDRGKELVAGFDGRVRGHIDGACEGNLLEVKSLSIARFDLVLMHGAFFEHMDQCQMYMRYGGYSRALIIYKCRESGELFVYSLNRSEERGERLEQKAKDVLAAVDCRFPPRCECGKCKR